MTNTERLIEAIIYGSEEDIPWWEAFDSKDEALKIINLTKREKADDNQVAVMISFREEYLQEDLTSEENYRYILKELKKELEEE